MFEEICLTCSKHLSDDGRAYCSDECESRDTYNSPSISSASSPLSSPYLDYTMGGEVPALVPSALGTALCNFQKRDRQSTSSSSTSSVSWSVFTDAEEDDAAVGIDEDFGYEGDSVDSNVAGIDASIRSMGSHHSSKSSSLMYTRRPSTTNHRSLIPLLHRRTSSSGSSFGQAPSSTDDDADFAYEAPPQSYHEEASSERERERHKLTVTSKTKKSRNRASLPAYFSLLHISSPQRSPPLSSSSGNTVNLNSQPSPPTPKLASLLAASGLRSTLEATPRGRRREPEALRRSRSRSQSRSRTRHNTVVPGPHGRQDSRSSVEQVFDWSCAPVGRGRPAVRRNSSPLPKMMLSMQEFEDPALIAGPASHANERRGRYRTQELDGRGSSRDAPGFGNGRSGLRERERGAEGAGRW
ncbi:hypothetical protein HYDPIDRAFT_105638 [Hydnomerulius pinastri MD-312]|nr:hypothetical protein HYDPIDRAFT_105638 [Hydnomerulius pinastri MD-312]